jgi:hypothetical protein
MQSALLVSDSEPRRIVIRPAASSSKKSSYILMLEHMRKQATQTSADTPRTTCTAQFQPAASFQANAYRHLHEGPIFGCLGLIQVEQGAIYSYDIADYIKETFICVVDDCQPVGDIDGSTVFRINNVLFFSLTSERYDKIADNGASFIVERDFVPQYQMQMSALDNAEDPQQQQYETLKHPCQALVRSQ